MDRLKRGHPQSGVISATRGNHGQSIALAAARTGIPATIVVPHGNSVEKNAAMRAFGASSWRQATISTHAETAMRLAEERGLTMVPSFHRDLVRGVATCARILPQCPATPTRSMCRSGLGSGICGTVAVRDALGLRHQGGGRGFDPGAGLRAIVRRGQVIATNSADTMADGMAVRGPDAEALDIILKGVDRIVAVGDARSASPCAPITKTPISSPKAAGAASLAALLQEQASMSGKRIGLIHEVAAISTGASTCGSSKILEA